MTAPARPELHLDVVGLRWRTTVTLTLGSLAGLAMFVWPLLVVPDPAVVGVARTADAPVVFLVILPVLVAVLLAEVASGGLDAKGLAMLGMLSAIGAALRPIGAGTGGVETVFFLLVLGGRVFGPGFGFVLGSTTMFASALLTGGVGPWLPFQMLAASWVGLFAGLLPRRPSGRAELGLLAAYGVASALVYGFLMNLWFWPYALGEGTALSFVAGDPMVDNLRRFVTFTVVTSTIGWDTGRAVTNAVAIVVLGPAILGALRRASRRAAFGVAPRFAPTER